MSGLAVRGGSATKDCGIWHLRWADGAGDTTGVFRCARRGENPAAEWLTMEDHERGNCQ